MTRADYAEQIHRRLSGEAEFLRRQFLTAGRIPSFVVDDLLEPDLAHKVFAAFPSKQEMRFRNNLRERKYVKAQMNECQPLLEEALYAFQDDRVAKLISEITGMAHIVPDEHLYAGGISLMTRGDFLNPHLDNSHDKDRRHYRALNLLYYVTPGWGQDDGGHFELWDGGPKNSPRVIQSKFNRLVVMKTSQSSYHSVSPVRGDRGRRCLSNYYFSPDSPDNCEYFHVTSFRGRPDQMVRDLFLRGDVLVRTAIRHVFRKGLSRWHVYKK